MKIILTTDWQLHDTPPHDQVDQASQKSTRFLETVETIAKVLDAGMALGADGLFFGGDLTEHKKPTPLESTAAAELFTRVMDKGGYVWALAGNHDGAIFAQSSSSIAPLARMRQDQFKLFHEVSVDLELGCLAIPYVHKATPEQLQAMVRKAWVDALMEGSPKAGQKFFAYAHYGIQGATMGTHRQQLPAGDYLSADTFLLKSNPVDRIICGHIHQGQELTLEGVPCFLPGSPTQQNRGEKADRKTWGLFDTATRELQVFEIPQPRKYIDIPYSPSLAKLPEEAAPQWGPDDIVTITGEYEKPDYPKDTLEAMFARGLPRPFSLTFETKAKRPERAARSTEISTEGGLRQALQQFLGEKYPNTSGEGNIVAPAAELAMTLLEEQGLKLYHPQLDPLHLCMKDFLTFGHYDAAFNPGKPTLIVGKNGIGKTNYFEGILWALTGQTSKNLNMSAVVRQNNQEARVVLDLVGHDGAGNSAQRYRITRSVKLAKTSGKPKHDLDLVRVDSAGKVVMRQDGQPDSLADGGMDDTQAKINAMLGGNYLTLKTTAFKFQNDTSPFIRAEPKQRKAVIGELIGLEPLARAHKILDKRRLESAQAFKSAEDRLGGMVAVGVDQEQRVAALKTDLEKVQADLEKQKELVPFAQAELDNAQAKDTEAKKAAQDLQDQLNLMPNTAAKVSAAEQELKTYQTTTAAARIKRETAWRALKADITKLQGELAELKAPSEEQLKTLEEALAGSKTALKALQDQNTAALGKLQGAQASLDAAKQSTKKAKEDLSATAVKLAALPLAAVPASEGLTQAQAAVKEADDKVIELTAEVSTATAQINSAQNLFNELEKEETAHQGQDIGTCTRCGQAIDSTQIEKDLERIKNDKALMLKQVTDGKAEKAAAEKKLGEILLAKMQSAARVTALQTEIQAAQLATQQKESLTTTFNEQTTAAGAAAQDELTKTQAASAAETDAAAVQGPLAAALALADQQQVELDKAKALALAVGSKAGQLKAKLDEDEKNTAAGKQEAEEAEAIIQQLEQALGIVKNEDLQNQALTGALRDKLEQKKKDAEGTATWLLTYSNNLSTTKAAVTLSEQRVTDLQASLKAIDDAKAAVQAAQLELGMLEQRRDIDAMACSLVDPKVGLPVYLIDQALPFLEDRINPYMQQLGMDRLTVELSTQEGDSETLAVLVDNGRPGPRLDIAAFSGGQLNRVERATKWAMSDLARQSRGVTFGLVCDDEPTDGLDDEGKEGYIRQIHERAGAYPVSLVVSHDETLIQSFDHRLRFSQGPSDETVVG